MSERATLRPITLGRLVEVTHACSTTPQSTEAIEEHLDVSHRRARSTILEALRIDLIEELSSEDEQDPTYMTTEIGNGFLDAVQLEAWTTLSDILAVRSPHYGAFIDVLETVETAELSELLERLEKTSEYEPYSYNEASIDVLGDWAERLGVVQRNAFTGSFYSVERETIPPNFAAVLLSLYDELEETAGLNLRQRHLSIPKLREYGCERLHCRREAFDDGLLALAKENVGQIELSGAPLDTAAKESPRGIKRISLATGESLVSTTQTSEQVMAGIELYGKQYYYLAVFDRNLTFEEPN